MRYEGTKEESVGQDFGIVKDVTLWIKALPVAIRSESLYQYTIT